MKTVDFSETIGVLVRCRQLIEFMKVCMFQRSGSFLDLGSKSFTNEN